MVWHYDDVTGQVYYTQQVTNNMTHGSFYPYDEWKHPEAVLGAPNMLDKNDNLSFLVFRRISLAWPANAKGTDNLSLEGTAYSSTSPYTKYNGCGLMAGGQIVVAFDEPIINDPNNPYGIDFIVHGNSYLITAEKDLYFDSNLDQYSLSGGVYNEPLAVSVAQYPAGPWFTFTIAPGNATVTADDYFPTNPYTWDSQNHTWTNHAHNWQKPVNPWMTSYFAGRTVAEGIRLYVDSAGGTPLDLDWLEANLPWIKYIKFTNSYYADGEICGIVRTAPAKIGDNLSVVPENIPVGRNELIFVDTDNASKPMARMVVTGLDQPASVQVARLDNLTSYPPLPNPKNLAAYNLKMDTLPNPGGAVNFTADIELFVSESYNQSGSDLKVYRWNGSAWESLTGFSYDPQTQMVTLGGVSVFCPVVVTHPISFSDILSALDTINPAVDLDGDNEITSTDLAIAMGNIP